MANRSQVSLAEVGYLPPPHASRVDKEDIKQGLSRAGLRAGDTVLVHSSLSRFGYVEGGADAVIDALLETVGPDGTLLMSAITTSSEFVVRCIEAAEAGAVLNTPPLDIASATTWAGAIPETFRRRPGVVRSLHPTHSVTAIGARASELLQGHHLAPGPCGKGTPFMRLADESRGFVLLLGVNHESNTTLHGVEEIATLEYVLYPKLCRVPILSPNGPREAHTRVHIPYLRRHLGALETQYIDGCAETVTQIGDSFVRCIHAATMRDLTLAALKTDPFRLLSAEGLKAWRIMRESGVYTRNPVAPQAG
jgi:aminoglycoside 3-N-acetyltransferase